MSTLLHRFALSLFLLALVACVGPGPDPDELISGQESELLPLIACSGGTADIQIDPETNEVSGTATQTGCFSLLHPGIHSATIVIHGTAIVSPLEIVTFTTDTTTWNTGQTTTQNAQRTFTGAGTVVEAGAGNSIAGLFHPSLRTDTGSGTRTNPQPFTGVAESEGEVENFRLRVEVRVFVNL
jgi:hypothetical protein